MVYPPFLKPVSQPWQGVPARNSHMAAPVLPLLAQSNSNPGKLFDVDVTPEAPIRQGQPTNLLLRLYNPWTGQPPAALQIVHEKPAHVFIVNQDLSEFQHVHPDVLGPGLLRIPAQFNGPGPHKLFMQFTSPEQGEQTLNKPLQLGYGAVPAKPMIPDAHVPKQVNGYTFRISGLPTRQQPMGMIRVDVLQNGKPVQAIQPYLGAAAHGVILSADAQSFIHTHPMSQPINGSYQSPVMFHTNINRPGLYKMWMQTQINGNVSTVDWTFQV